MDETALTRDAWWAGAISLWQPARGRGYRFNLDPVLLAHFAQARGHVLDLGAGCGIVGILLLKRGWATRVTAVEQQPLLAEAIRRNVEANGLAGAIDVVEGDLREVGLPEVDAVVANPPYVALGTGQEPPESGRRLARVEANGTIGDFVRVGASCVKDGGTLSMILPLSRWQQLDADVGAADLMPRRHRRIVPRAEAECRHILVELVKGAVAEACEEPPLVVHAADGYSAEVKAMLRGPDEVAS